MSIFSIFLDKLKQPFMLSQLLLKFSNIFETLIVEISVLLVYSVVLILKCFTNDKFLVYI